MKKEIAVNIRQARPSELGVGTKVIYQEDPHDCSSNAPNVTIKGFIPYIHGCSGGKSLFVVEMFSGRIFLAFDKQLFTNDDHWE